MEKQKLNLPKAQFHSAGRPGVVYLIAGDGERHYYIRYRTSDGKQRFEKAVIPGVRMSAAKADQLRQDRARGISIPNRERRKEEQEATIVVKAETERAGFAAPPFLLHIADHLLPKSDLTPAVLRSGSVR